MKSLVMSTYFNISNLKKCLSDKSLVIPMKELRLDDKLNFVEEPVEIMDREVKQLKQSRIPIIQKQRSRRPKRDTEIPQSSGPTDNVADKAVNEEMDDCLVRAATTTSSLEAEQDSGNTLRSGKDSLKLKELMAFCITLQTRVLAFETINTTQANEINSLKWRDASKQGRIADIDANKDIYLVNVQTDEDMFSVNDLDGDEVIVDNVDAAEDIVVIEKAKLVSATEETVNAAATIVSTASTILVTNVEITLAQALAELKSAKPKADKVVIQEPEQGTTTTTTATAASTRPKAKGIVFHEQEQAPTPIVSSQQPSQVRAQDKGKGIMVEESVSKIEVDYQLAQRLQAQEQEELTDAEKRTKDELEQESSKRQKLEEDKESKELKQCLEIIPDDGDGVTIDATPLSTKSPTIVDYKIYKKGKKSYFQIIRADGKTQMYLTFGKMLKNFDREDLEIL
ncbi:hypothetical protein Tco_1403100 [Tanacetum coccineum]